MYIICRNLFYDVPNNQVAILQGAAPMLVSVYFIRLNAFYTSEGIIYV